MKKCEQCISGKVCKHRTFVNFESMQLLKRLVKIGVISPEISQDLIDKTANTILDQCQKTDRGC